MGKKNKKRGQNRKNNTSHKKNLANFKPNSIHKASKTKNLHQ